MESRQTQNLDVLDFICVFTVAQPMQLNTYSIVQAELYSIHQIESVIISKISFVPVDDLANTREIFFFHLFSNLLNNHKKLKLKGTFYR